MPAARAHLGELLSAQTAISSAAAWQRFVAQYSKLILSVARSVDRDYDAAMDRYTFILEHLRRDDYKKLRSYAVDPDCKFTTWLVVVCRRLCIDQQRSKHGRIRAGSNVIELHARRSLTQSLFSTIPLETLVAPEQQRPDVFAEQQEMHERLEHCLARLTDRDRLLIKLRFEDERSAVEIMQLLKLPTPFHVYRRINQLLKDLHAALTLGGIPPSAPQKESRVSVKSFAND